MSRYIDADALMEHAEQYLKSYNDMYEAMESGYTDEERDAVDAQRCTATEFVALIHNAPTVDAVQVVRCKKCRHGTTAHGISDGWVLCTKPYVTDTVGAMMHPNDWFCADGERRN